MQGRRHTSLLASAPEGIGDLLGWGTTSDLDGLSVLSDGNTVELVQVDLDAMVHTSQSGDGSMGSVVGEEGQLLLVGIFDLKELLQAHVMPSKEPTVSETSFSVPGTTTTLIVGAPRTDHRVVALTKSSEPGK